jgi:putative ABC transport system permease protein
MLHWNPYRLVSPTELPENKDLYHSGPELASDDPDGVSVGGRLARTLELTVNQTSTEQAPQSQTPAPAAEESSEDLRALSQEMANTEPETSARPSVELICAPPGGGMPNATTVAVRKIFTRGTRELDNQLIKIDIRRASDLLFPSEELKVTSVLIVLKKTADVPAVLARVRDLIAKGDLDLDYGTWDQLRPYYRQLTTMFRVMFTFMFCIIAVIVTFTIYNTLSMGIAERVSEIGTLRAMGVTRAGIRKSFLLEGFLLGLIGGILGVVVGIVGGLIINALQIAYVPPGAPFYTRLEVLVLRAPLILVICFGGALVAALLSAILPAHKASRMIIVDALRH